MQLVFENVSSNLSFKFSQKRFRISRVDHFGDTEALNRDLAHRFGQTDTWLGLSEMLGFHRNFTSVSPISTTRWYRDVLVQWPEPDR